MNEDSPILNSQGESYSRRPTLWRSIVSRLKRPLPAWSLIGAVAMWVGYDNIKLLVFPPVPYVIIVNSSSDGIDSLDVLLHNTGDKTAIIERVVVRPIKITTSDSDFMVAQSYVASSQTVPISIGLDLTDEYESPVFIALNSDQADRLQLEFSFPKLARTPAGQNQDSVSGSLSVEWELEGELVGNFGTVKLDPWQINFVYFRDQDFRPPGHQHGEPLPDF